MSEQEFLDLLEQTIQHDLRHDHYDRTLEITDWARMMVTGKGQEKMITSLRERESPEQKAQRIKITKTLTRYAAGQIRSYFRKARRADGIKKVVSHSDPATQERLEEMLSTFHGGRGLEEYLFDRFEYFTFIDPNAFIVTERRDVRDEFGEITGTAVYPFEVYSRQAIRYQYDNGLLQYLIIELEHTEKTLARQVNGVKTYREDKVSDFYLYAPGLTVKLSEYIHAEPEISEGQEKVEIRLSSNKVRNFIREIHHPGNTEIPAFRVGVYPDLETDGEVFVTPLEPAKELFEKLINTGSELDINRVLHAFQQKIVALPECEYTDQETGLTCSNGWLGEESVCPSCKGRGVDIHSSGQDVIILKMSRAMLEDNLTPPIKDLVHYVTQDPFAPQFLTESLNTTLQRIPLAVFNTEIQLIPQFAATATKEKIEVEKIYDTIRPYTKGLSRAFMHSARITTQYIERSEGFTAEHAFPSDLGMKSMDELVEDYRAAVTAGLPFDVLEGLLFDILQKQHPNNPDVVAAVKARHKFKPWRDKTTEQVVQIVSGRAKSDPDRVLYENFAAIFDRIEADTAQEIPFYLRPYDRQKELVDRAVQEYIDSQEVQEPQPRLSEQLEPAES